MHACCSAFTCKWFGVCVVCDTLLLSLQYRFCCNILVLGVANSLKLYHVLCMETQGVVTVECKAYGM
jgi:hypothetical protein